MVKCKECEKEFDNLFSLKIHRGRIHKISAEQTYIDYNLNGEEPKCGCGCGDKPKFLGINEGFREFMNGHNSRVKNNYQSNPDIKIKSAATQKAKHASGELKGWCTGLTMDDPRLKALIEKTISHPDRGRKISEFFKDKPKSQEHKDKLSELAIERWKDPKRREDQSLRLIKRLKDNNYKNKKTKLELLFENLLLNLDIKFEYQFILNHSMFDFYLPDFNILIEVDGDFHHCNPNSKHKEPIYPIQKKTMSNDIYKNNLCVENNIKLYRFWEYDIKNNYDDVVNKVKEILDL